MKHGVIYLDLGSDETLVPERGDVLLGPRAAWRVLDARPTDSPRANRWTLRVRALGVVADKRRPPLPDKGGLHWHVGPAYRR